MKNNVMASADAAGQPMVAADPSAAVPDEGLIGQLVEPAGARLCSWGPGPGPAACHNDATLSRVRKARSSSEASIVYRRNAAAVRHRVSMCKLRLVPCLN